MYDFSKSCMRIFAVTPTDEALAHDIQKQGLGKIQIMRSEWVSCYVLI